mmetsp:Transcript_20623/g.31542  ORF Transcript_20623/g.31542 Transcript_20623/m.31542 type:complete len:1162 (-) Transcript_20623:344-3829(-)|eukprot:CAMPEP_0196826414 /NCGR_PEP_ID=MMETSP1362-20130617/93610_1 /TAXON_ID=163516 /ORGANISM="Leptocylindrus danicus, Strain CCMP1856" /LENGTH=1161 /DNA_ID=CAMNT_0042206983 /DNA_START=2447 /DNA_END=5932 /DNA_ORIENTATION=+
MRLNQEETVAILEEGNSYQYSPTSGRWSQGSKKSTSSAEQRPQRLKQVFFIGAVLLLVGASLLRSDDILGDGKDEAEVATLKEAYTTESHPVLSTVTPEELDVPTVYRGDFGSPGPDFGSFFREGVMKTGQALPTNRWYQNLLMANAENEFNRVYTIPYIVDTSGGITGVRFHFPRVMASSTIVQMTFEGDFGLTVGTDSKGVENQYALDEQSNPSELGVTLKWQDPIAYSDGVNLSMSAPIVRGMPYITMRYSTGVVPAIQSNILPASPPLLDGANPLKCDGTIARVNREIQVHFKASDFTYLIFFSRPVDVQCYVDDEEGKPSNIPGVVVSSHTNFLLRVADDSINEVPMIVRAALANNCTSGLSPTYCEGGKTRDNSAYMEQLRQSADLYPNQAYVRYAFPDKDGIDTNVENAAVSFDWDVHSMAKDTVDDIALESFVLPQAAPVSENKWWWKDKQKVVARPSLDKPELLMYALPHQLSILQESDTSSNKAFDHCIPTLHGKSCLVQGNEWLMNEDLDGPPSFLAPRPPKAFAIPELAKAIATDIEYTPPSNYMAGAGDTYFSGKMIAKLGRILVIASELKELATYTKSDIAKHDNGDGELESIVEACKNADLPSDETMNDAVARLRSGVEIWLNGTAAAIFTYDGKYGGLISCGCSFDTKIWDCANRFPNCPAYVDAGMNFGNGFYNDHHFHYGYHIYAAAVVAQYDHEWGKEYFQHVMQLIRDIANPSSEDTRYPTFRHKDWYLGSSWASGIATINNGPYPNGRNQESSSEAIAAYEGIALYGEAMTKAFGGDSARGKDYANAVTASRIRDLGRLLTATEVRSADKYWHSRSSDSPDRIYPPQYTPPSVGMLWSLMAQFQTWFGNAPFLPIGIQLLPITAVSERRDAFDWVKDVYQPFDESCSPNPMCEEQGWSILGYCVLAEVGHADLAFQKALKVPHDVFDSAGGDGHSMTNTLWYISTRPKVETPLDLNPPKPKPDTADNGVPDAVHPVAPVQLKHVTDCGLNATCTWEVLDANAGGFKCRDRIDWVMNHMSKTEAEACHQVAGIEYRASCGGCDPLPSTTTADSANTTTTSDDSSGKNTTAPIAVEFPNSKCPPCSTDVCNKNKCPLGGTWFLCTDGAATDGCSQAPWIVTDATTTVCDTCCKLTSHCGESN